MPEAAQIPMVPVRSDRLSSAEMVQAAESFAERMALRRSVREFSPDPFPPEVVEAAIRAAASAPSGANVQPWRFVAVTDPHRRRRLREAAEAEELAFYQRRASAEWLQALAPLGTDWRKPLGGSCPRLSVTRGPLAGCGQPHPSVLVSGDDVR